MCLMSKPLNNLYHYSHEVITDFTQRELVFGDFYDETRKLDKYYLRPSMKPEGLWFSPEDATREYDESWRAYCSDLSLNPLTYKYHVKLSPDANLLLISDVSGMYKFCKKYRSKEDVAVYGNLGICWQYVALDYQGIIISPYQHSLRLDSDFYWYYPWDCASGCIWDISAISSLTLLQGG